MAGRRATCRQVTVGTGGPTTWACEDTAPCPGAAVSIWSLQRRNHTHGARWGTGLGRPPGSPERIPDGHGHHPLAANRSVEEVCNPSSPAYLPQAQ